MQNSLTTLPAAYATPLAITIFLVTLTLIIWQPRGLGIGFSAIGGALLALITGIVKLQDISAVWGIVWNATFTLVALVIVALILDEAGFFRWLALHLAQWGRGINRLLFVLIILLGAVISAVFTNDATALIWTPTVLEILLLLGYGSSRDRVSPRLLAFVMATGFIADAASLPLKVSNLVNLISADYFEISFVRYALVMIPVNFVAVFTSLAVLWFYFDRYLSAGYQLDQLPTPSSAIRDPLLFRWSVPILLVLLAGYLIAEPLGIPVSFIASLAVLMLLPLAGRWLQPSMHPVIDLRKVFREAPWQVIPFSLGMYLIVFGLRNADLIEILSHGLEKLSRWGITQAAMGTGFLATLLSSITNNLPTVFINATAIQNATAITDPAVREAMVYANIIGCDIGAKIMPTGSISTLIWLHVLACKGIHISWGQYIRISLVLTLPVLFFSLLSLAIWLPWLIA